jgi:hypothetical protein
MSSMLRTTLLEYYRALAEGVGESHGAGDASTLSVAMARIATA